MLGRVWRTVVRHRWVVVVIGAAGLVVLAGCGGGQSGSEPTRTEPPAKAKGLIAFDGGQGSEYHPERAGIYLMRADGRGKPRRLTKGFDLFPAWSPDGGKIAFTRDWSKNIYIINADARGLRRLKSAPGIARDFTWSPDGRLIGFGGDGSRQSR